MNSIFAFVKSAKLSAAGLAWFGWGSLAPFLFATCNLMDKYVLEKYFKKEGQTGGVGALLLFSALFAIIPTPFFLLAEPNMFAMSTSKILWFALLGAMEVVILWCYLNALNHDDSSVVATYYQLMPVFALFTARIILGEVVTPIQLLSAAVVLVGTTILALEIDIKHRFKFRWRTMLFMVGATLTWAIQETLFKWVALDVNVWRTLFWKHVAYFIVGVLIFAFSTSYRNGFKRAWKHYSGKLIGLNIANESLFAGGTIALGYAVMLTQVAIVSLLITYQAAVVLVLGLVLARLSPQMATERLSGIHLKLRVVALVTTGIGTAMLVFLR